MRASSCMLLAALIACGGEGGSSTYSPGPTPPGGNTPAPPTSSASISINTVSDGYGADSYQFAPQRVSVTLGGTVTWTNTTGIAHSVEFTGDEPGDIASFASGSQSRTFSNSGTYDYVCGTHAWMTGEITVP